MPAKEDHLDLINSLFSLYNQVKEIIVLCEYNSPEQSYPISCANELKATLDHIMKTFNSQADIKQEVERAKGHLYRGGFDAYEIIASYKLLQIKNIRQSYKLDAIVQGYPQYHTQVVPLLSKTQSRLAKARSNKLITDVKKEEENFKEYESIVTDLMQTWDNICLHLSGIKEANDNLRKKRNLQIAGIVLTAILLPLTFLGIEYSFFNTPANNSVSGKADSTIVKQAKP